MAREHQEDGREKQRQDEGAALPGAPTGAAAGAAGAGGLPGDAAAGEGPEWRGKLDELRERRREKRWLHRLREPLIGLTMAGAAAPIAYSVSHMAPETTSRKPEGVPEKKAASALPADVEDAVGQRWSEAQQQQVRNDTIEGAVARYGIDRSLAATIYDVAQQEGIEPDLAYGLVNTESTFRDHVTSAVGARGLTQVMPRTARWLVPEVKSAHELFEPRTNLTVGFRYLRHLLDKYEGNVRLALLAYNRGPGTVDRILKRGGNPDNGYARRVLSG